MQPTQDGDGGLGLWIDTDGLPLQAAGSELESRIGLYFVVPAGQVTAGTLRMTLSEPAPAGALALSWVPDLAPIPYSAVFLPGDRDELLLAEANVSGGATGAVEFTLGQTPNGANAATCAATLAQMLAASVGWSALALTISTETDDHFFFDSLEFGSTPAQLELVAAAILFPSAARGFRREFNGTDDGILGALEREQRERFF